MHEEQMCCHLSEKVDIAAELATSKSVPRTSALLHVSDTSARGNGCAAVYRGKSILQSSVTTPELSLRVHHVASRA
jgi:hypothetical protein